MKNTSKLLKLILLLLYFCNTVPYGMAQKLPNVQEAGLRAPANSLTDGKPKEWGGQFQAYNKATEIFYSIANDDKKLYLVAQTTSEIVMNRIANGGIKLIIQKSGTKTDAGAPFIKFPFLQKGKKIMVSFVNSIPAGRNGMRRAPEPKNAAEAKKISDSLVSDNNKRLIREHKWIYTSGIAGVDTLLAIYNEKGIQVAHGIDSKKAYTYELAVDLKLLGLQLNEAEKFSYHIVINGEPNKSKSPVGPAFFAGDPVLAAENAERIRRLNEQMEARYATTDFWGEYTLAK